MAFPFSQCNHIQAPIGMNTPFLCYSRGLTLNSKRRRMQVKNVSQDDGLSAQELFESFLRERRSSTDFISKASDTFWHKEVFGVDEEKLTEVKQRLVELQKTKEEDDSGGFLKLSKTKRWDLGVDGAPINAKPAGDGTQRPEDGQRRVSFLEYEALKRELSLLTAGVAALCTTYCVVILSVEASISYGIGALGSLFYLQLLFRRADQLSEDNLAEVFLRRRKKNRIGIRTGDIQDAFEKALLGSGMALSSPRLAVPAALFGIWTLVHQFNSLNLKLELAPLMLGFFAYKGALYVQAYRDNKDLAMTFPEEEIKT